MSHKLYINIKLFTETQKLPNTFKQAGDAFFRLDKKLADTNLQTSHLADDYHYAMQKIIALQANINEVIKQIDNEL